MFHISAMSVVGEHRGHLKGINAKAHHTAAAGDPERQSRFTAGGASGVRRLLSREIEKADDKSM